MPRLFCCFSGNKNSTDSSDSNTTIISSESAQPSYNNRTHNEHGIIHNNERPVQYNNSHSILYHNQRRVGQNNQYDIEQDDERYTAYNNVAYPNDRVSGPNTLRPRERPHFFANDYRTNPEIFINSNLDDHEHNYTGAFYAPGHQQSDSSDSLDSYERLRITDSQNRPRFSHLNSSYAPPVTRGINSTVVAANNIHIKSSSKHRQSEKIQAVPDVESSGSLSSAAGKYIGSSNDTLFTIGVKSEGSTGSAKVPSIQL